LAPTLSQGAKEMGLVIEDTDIDRLCAYIDLLDKWNQAYSLTAVRDPQQMATRHLLDSLSVIPYLNGPHVIDVGSGAGLPGIPLAITQEDKHFVLLDSQLKKTRFLTQVATALGLQNVEVVRERVEQYSPVQPFDTVISRAFSSVRDFIRSAGPLCAPTGRLLAMKGAEAEVHPDEIINNFKVTAIETLIIPHLNARRQLVCFEQGYD